MPIKKKSKEMSMNNMHDGCCCHCNKLMALAIVLLTWIPSVSNQLWAKIVITILALLVAMSHSKCFVCRMKK